MNTTTPRPAIILIGGFTVAWNQRFLDAAHTRDLAVLLLDAPGPHVDGLKRAWRQGADGPLADVADIALAACDDLGGIVEQCARWAGQYAVQGVSCLREDYVDAASVVADLLGLPSPGRRAAKVCRNKFLQRRYLKRWSPQSTLVTPDRRTTAVSTWDLFPVIVKPTGRFASSGVRIVSSLDELRGCLTDYADDETLLFEERVAGPEFSVETLLHDGRVCYESITQKRTTESDSAFFVEMAHTTPPTTLDPAAREAILAAHAEILQRLDFGTGMAHAEYRVTAQGRPYLIEIAARPPGDSILALHWLATGVPLEDALVALAVGQQVAHPEPKRFARQVYLPHEPGTLVDLTADPALGEEPTWFQAGVIAAQVRDCGAAGDPPALRCIMALKPRDKVLGPIRESSDRAAMFVIDAATPDELDALEARCRAAITLEVRA